MLKKILCWMLNMSIAMGIIAIVGICFVPSVKATHETHANFIEAVTFFCFTDADCTNDQTQCVFETASTEVGYCD